LAFGPAAVDGVGRADPEEAAGGVVEVAVARGVGAEVAAGADVVAGADAVVAGADAVVAGALPPSHPATRPALKQITPVVATRNRRVRRRLDTASSMGGRWTEGKRPSA
jgi:hypothetical protein